MDGEVLEVVEIHRDRRRCCGSAGPAGRRRRQRSVSPMLLPKKSSRSLPASPSTTSLPSPGSHWNRSSPSPQERAVDALVAVERVVAGPAEQQVGAVAAAQRVVRPRRRRRSARSAGRGCRSRRSCPHRRGRARRGSRPRSYPSAPSPAATTLARGAVRDDVDRIGARGAAVADGVGTVAAVDIDGAGPATPTAIVIVSAPPSVATVTLSSAASSPATRVSAASPPNDDRSGGRADRARSGPSVPTRDDRVDLAVGAAVEQRRGRRRRSERRCRRGRRR